MRRNSGPRTTLDFKTPTPLQLAHAETAMAILKKYGRLVYRDPDILHGESALDPLRDRPDFKLLMMDLAFPADPFAVGR